MKVDPVPDHISLGCCFAQDTQKEDVMSLNNFKFRSVFAVFFFLLLLFVTGKAYSATYHVAKGGDNTAGNGSATNPWLTIGKCASAMVPGDSCVVAAGLYEEAVKPANSGLAGKPLTFAAKAGDQVTIRQFLLNNLRYIRVIGFTFTHNSSTYASAIQMNNSHHCEVLNNTFHHLYGEAIKNYHTTGRADYTLVRGNTISYPGCPEGVAGECKGSSAINLWGDYNIIEYNEILHAPDSFNTNGHFVFVRNNYVHDQRDIDFPDTSTNIVHIDFWQAFMLAGAPNNRIFIESNFSRDNPELNSHFFQHRDVVGAGDQEVVIRKNVGIRFGSYVAQLGAVDKTRIYNNTFSDFYYNKTKGSAAVIYMAEGGNPSTDNVVMNNVFHRVANPNWGTVIGLITGCAVTAANNMCIESGLHPSCVAASNVNFVNYSADDLHLQETSSARNVGTAITTVTSPGGSGMYFTVADAGYFTDGAGIVTGDSIKVGSGNPVTITAINYETNLITVPDSISWQSGDGVYLARHGADIGAYPFSSTNGQYEIQIINPADGATVAGIASITASVTNAGNVRFVIFYVDGIPAGKIENPPYTYTWNLEGLEKKNYHVEARAYSYYADPVTSKSSKVNLVVGDAPKLSPPGNLIISQ